MIMLLTESHEDVRREVFDLKQVVIFIEETGPTDFLISSMSSRKESSVSEHRPQPSSRVFF